MNLIEGIQEKCNYIRETIIPEYDKLGQVGAFGKIVLVEAVLEGERAIAGGDAVEMLRLYQELEELCDRAL